MLIAGSRLNRIVQYFYLCRNLSVKRVKLPEEQNICCQNEGRAELRTDFNIQIFTLRSAQQPSLLDVLYSGRLH